MKLILKLVCLSWLVGCLAGCGPSTTEREGLPPLQVVERVDIPRYMGTWYEIASFPHRFQEGCTGTTASYTLRDDGGVDVVNRCFHQSLQGEEKVAEGRARVVDTATNAKLEVSFFGPFWGDYWIIELGDEYEYAVVGHPGRDYLWILSRTPRMDDATFDALVARLREVHRYDVGRLQKTLQPQQ
jgi:apolipoprotein D and lipocalin family protein